MVVASVAEVLATVDGFVGFGVGVLASWLYWRHHPRHYTFDVTLHHEPIQRDGTGEIGRE
jgi:hypothetical protein